VFAVGDLVRRQQLEGDEAIEVCVAGLVDHAHAALAELGFDAVAIEGLADHLERNRRAYLMPARSG